MNGEELVLNASFHTPSKYCHKGSTAFADRVGWDDNGAPSALPVAANRMVKPKTQRGAGSMPFGGEDALVRLSRREKYCHNGGMAHHTTPP
jgi:hypothetical protein